VTEICLLQSAETQRFSAQALRDFTFSAESTASGRVFLNSLSKCLSEKTFFSLKAAKSADTTFTHKLFPQPGTPSISTPRAGSMPLSLPREPATALPQPAFQVFQAADVVD